MVKVNNKASEAEQMHTYRGASWRKKHMNQLEEQLHTHLTIGYLLTNVWASNLFQGTVSQTWRIV